MTRLVLAAILALSAPAVAGCSGSDSEPAVETAGDEQALTEAKTLAKGISYPSGLVVAGDHIYFGSNKFISSGDPELDQQFAYWKGKYSRVALAGGRPEMVAEFGPISQARLSGNYLYYGVSAGCSVSRVDISGAPADDKTVYFYDHCDPDSGQWIIGFEVTPANKLVVALSDGTVLSGNLDGSAMEKLADLQIGESADVTEAVAFADGALYILTRADIWVPGEQNQNFPPALYRIDLTSGATSKVYEFAKAPRIFTSDGKNLFWSDFETLSLFAPGATQPKTIAKGFAEIAEIASDGKSVFVADSKRDSIYIVKDAFAAEPKRQRKLAVAKGLTTMILSGDSLYFGTQVVENRKVAGIIGQVKLPQ